MDDFSMSDYENNLANNEQFHHQKQEPAKAKNKMSLHYFGPRDDREAFGITPESYMEMDMNALLIEDKVASYLYVASDDNLESVQKNAVLVVDRALKHQVGDIVVVAVDGEVLLRRFIKMRHPQHNRPVPALIIDKDGEPPIFPEFTEVFFKGVVRSIIIFCRPCQ